MKGKKEEREEKKREEKKRETKEKRKRRLAFLIECDMLKTRRPKPCRSWMCTEYCCMFLPGAMWKLPATCRVPCNGRARMGKYQACMVVPSMHGMYQALGAAYGWREPPRRPRRPTHVDPILTPVAPRLYPLRPSTPQHQTPQQFSNATATPP